MTVTAVLICITLFLTDNAGDSSGSASPDPGYVRTLSPGELIWGPVKTYPSWPGKLVSYNDVPKNPKSEDGKVSNIGIIFSAWQLLHIICCS